MNNITEDNLNDPSATHNIALGKAKIKLMSTADAVFFTHLCFSLKHKWNLDIPTAQTNGLDIEYNPHFFLSLSSAEQVFLMIHETMHVAYMHLSRRGSRDPERWNDACDYVINAQLIDRGFQMPKVGLYEPRFSGMAVEQVYDLIPSSSQGGPQNAMRDLGIGKGSSDPNAQGVPGGMSPEELQRKVEDILVHASVQSQMNNDKPGTIPGDIQIFLKKLLDPKLPWHRILAKYMNKYAKNDYSWRKPSRRYFPQHYLPSLYSESLMDLCFAVDTSGSVSDEDFNRFISEVSGVFKMMKPEKLTLIQFDTEIKSVDHIKSLNDLQRVKFTGRGGTDVTDVLKWANENKPQVLLIFTDVEFHNPGIETKTDLVWLIHDNTHFRYNMGKVIFYDIHDK